VALRSPPRLRVRVRPRAPFAEKGALALTGRQAQLGLEVDTNRKKYGWQINKVIKNNQLITKITFIFSKTGGHIFKMEV